MAQLHGEGVGNRTRLFRKTVYEHRFRPALYWNLITNFAADHAHAHAYVLEHVKHMSESSRVAIR